MTGQKPKNIKSCCFASSVILCFVFYSIYTEYPEPEYQAAAEDVQRPASENILYYFIVRDVKKCVISCNKSML